MLIIKAKFDVSPKKLLQSIDDKLKQQKKEIDQEIKNGLVESAESISDDLNSIMIKNNHLDTYDTIKAIQKDYKAYQASDGDIYIYIGFYNRLGQWRNSAANFLMWRDDKHFTPDVELRDALWGSAAKRKIRATITKRLKRFE